MSNQTALDKFVANVAASQALLESLKQHLDNHLEVDPDEVNWGHVGESGRIRDHLQELVCECLQLMPVEV